jgi:ABC-type Fe3+/spermidine/putrescine transport system ATPase subunit
MSDRIVIMRDGRIEQVGSPLELYESPTSRFSASFLGKSNFLHRDGALLALRPEKIDIVPSGGGDGTSRLSGTIRTITYFGSMQRIIVALPDGDTVEVDIDSWRVREKFSEGQAVDLHWEDSAAVKLERDD